MLGLLSQSGGANKTIASDFTFRKKIERQHEGYEQLITYDELNESDFVKDDSIKAFVYLKADKLIRSSVV